MSKELNFNQKRKIMNLAASLCYKVGEFTLELKKEQIHIYFGKDKELRRVLDRNADFGRENMKQFAIKFAEAQKIDVASIVSL